MEPISVVILGAATVATVSLVETNFNQRNSSIYNNQRSQRIPKHVLVILETIDRTYGYTGMYSRVEYANHIWNYYDLNRLQFRPGTPAIRWRRGVKEQVLSSHSFWNTFSEAFRFENTLKQPWSYENYQKLTQRRISVAGNVLENDLLKDVVLRNQQYNLLLNFILEHYNFNFQGIQWNADGSPYKIVYTTHWTENRRLPNGTNIQTPVTVEDCIKCFQILAETGTGIENGGDNIVCYGLIAQDLHRDFFHLFTDLEKPDWHSKYYSQPIRFPMWPKVQPVEIPSGIGMGTWPVKYVTNTTEQSGLYDFGKHVARYYRPYSKDLYSCWDNDTRNHIPWGMITPGTAWNAINGVSFLQPYRNIENTWPHWPCTSEFYNNQGQVMHNLGFRPIMAVFPLKDYPWPVPTGNSPEDVLLRNSILSRKKYFSWYFTEK